MTCCKADEYGRWCKDFPTTGILIGGEEYCVFHAPKEDKNASDKEFNDRVFEHVQEAIDSGEECNLSGAIFPGPISFGQFDKDKPLPQ